MLKPPSLHLEMSRAVVTLRRPLEPEEAAAWDAAALAIREATGFAVAFEAARQAPAAREPRDASGRLEVNTAYGAIRDAFAGARHVPHRIGRKPGAEGAEPYIEVAFISPEVGLRYRSLLDELAASTGWRLEVSAAANQFQILETARSLLAGLSVRRGPSYQPAARQVTVALASPLDEAARERLETAFHEQTGYRLAFEGR